MQLHYGFLTDDTAYIELPLEIYDRMIADYNSGKESEKFSTTHPRLDVIPYRVIDVGPIETDGCFGVTFEVGDDVRIEDIRTLSQKL